MAATAPDPTPGEIAKMTAAIRRSWTAAEERRRRGFRRGFRFPSFRARVVRGVPVFRVEDQ